MFRNLYAASPIKLWNLVLLTNRSWVDFGALAGVHLLFKRSMAKAFMDPSAYKVICKGGERPTRHLFKMLDMPVVGILRELLENQEDSIDKYYDIFPLQAVLGSHL